MSEHITRCPECGTSFRISESHLNAGKGAVRCGSCLHVFNARENLVQQKEPELEEEPLQEEEPQLEKEQDEEEDVLISDTMEMDAARANSVVSSAEVGDEFSDEFNHTFADTLREKSATGEHEFNLFERDDNLAENEDDDVSQDESWALDLLNDDDEESEEKEKENEHDEYSESDAQLEREMSEELDDDGTYYASSSETRSDYDNPFQIIEEEPEQFEEQREKSPLERYNKYDDVELEDPEEDDNEQTYAQPIHSTGSYPAANYSTESYSTGTDYLSAIEPEPVEFDYQANSSFWNSKAFWASLSAVAGLLLAVQFAWIKFPTLSTLEPYRAYYSKACDLIGCQLPNLIDRSKIRSTNLVVRSHPHVRGALVVDAVIQNTAKFEQSFPTMDLIFTDARDNIVAARRLHPEDYLGGELAGRSSMPIKQPIHIALEISDPGEKATGYRIIIAN